ncbi:hypothetical protein [Paenibacillus sp. FSL R7-0302]|uniref:hypothetical protein n=1 Tax=Paenibacillus sp. FSL R7-0302 TaxID=2921681 RepID=UPI004046925C
MISTSGEKNVLIKILPQGWSFFSKSPRDHEFVVLDPDTLELAVAAMYGGLFDSSPSSSSPLR